MSKPFSDAIITTAGAALLARVEAGQAAMEITRVVVGEGIYTPEEREPGSLKDRTALKIQRGSFTPSHVDIVSEDSIRIRALVSNVDPVTGDPLVTIGYFFNELGVYAKERDGASTTECLYCIAITSGDTGDYMPPYEGGGAAQIIQDIYLTVGNAATTYVDIAGAAFLATDGQQLKTDFADLSGEFDDLSDDMAAFKTHIETVVGAPLVASAAAEMTDTTRVYVYVGSETGYTSGNWYYYDGTSWVSGGVYNATAVSTDKTLTQEDQPADAKKTGDEITALKDDYNELKSAIDQLQIKLTVSVNNANYNIIFPVLNGHTYKITNNASANASAYTADQSNTQIQDIGTIGKNGGTATFTASTNAYKIRGYCSGSGSITVEDLGTDVSVMQQTLADVVPRLSAVETIAENSKNQLIIDTSSLNSGYIGTDGAVNSSTSNNEKYTNRIGCIPGQKFTVNITLPSSNGMWLTYAEYDKKGKFITRDGGTHGWVATYTETFTVPSGVYAIIVSYRAFTGGTITISCDSWSYFMTNINLPSLTLQRDFHLQNSAYDVSVRGINHTGYYTAPENTLPAYKLSKANGFAFVETDLQLSSDNVPVLIHDTSINRTGRNSDGTEIPSTLYVHDLTYQQLQQYDFGIWKSSEYAGTKIPSLEQFIVLCKNLNLHAYIELKGGFWTTATFAIAYGIVEKYQMETRVTWISTSDNYLKLVKAKDEYARIAYVVSDIDTAIITACTNLLTEHNSVVIDVLYTAITTEKIALAVAAGLPIEAYTINSESDLRSLDGYISGVTSDIYNYSAWLVEENTN